MPVNSAKQTPVSGFVNLKANAMIIGESLHGLVGIVRVLEDFALRRAIVLVLSDTASDAADFILARYRC